MVHLENDNEYEPLATKERAAGAVLRLAQYRRINYTAQQLHEAAELLLAWEQAAEQYGVTLKDLAVCNTRLPGAALDVIRARTRPPSTP